MQNRYVKVFFLLIFYLFFCVPQSYSLTLKGLPYESLSTIQSRLGMKQQWLKSQKKLRLYSKWSEIIFTANSREVSLNSIKVYLGHSIVAHQGQLYVSVHDYEKSLAPILTPQRYSGIPKLQRIVIDPGHGGKDPGAANSSLSLREKSVTFDLAKRLRLELLQQGYEVFLTRSSDQYLGLYERAQISNRLNSDLFISLHFNSTGNKSVSGIETYSLAPLNQPSTAASGIRASDKVKEAANVNDPWNMLLAYNIQKSMIKTVRAKDRGLKRARFAVLKRLECPAVLIEGGFMSNYTEAKNIGWHLYRNKLAKSIANGVIQYDKSLKRARSR